MSKVEGTRCAFSNQPSSPHQQAHIPQTKDRAQATRTVSPQTPRILRYSLVAGFLMTRDMDSSAGRSSEVIPNNHGGGSHERDGAGE